MTDDDTAVSLEMEQLSAKIHTASSPPSGSLILKPHTINEFRNNQAVMTKQTHHPLALSPVTPTKGSSKSRYTCSKVTATLENESVWSRFHSIGTEMILTMQGRRMFPCCRFKLNGLDPEKKYILIMDIVPLDGFTHRWNGNTWKPMAIGEAQSLARVCVHPDSPASGQQWMESPVSFYKVKLTNNSSDQEGCLILRPMHRYQSRLHIVPFDPDLKEGIPLNSPNVQMFTFPKTEFYAVTSYQNPQITQLKIDCNPFAVAFRKDSQSIRLLQDKLGLFSLGKPHTQTNGLNLPSSTSEPKRNEDELKHITSPCIRNDRKKHIFPGSPTPKESRIIQTKNTNYPNSDMVCKDVDSSQNDRSRQDLVRQPSTKPAVDEHEAPLDVCAKSKWWSNVKCPKPPLNVSLQPDLEDVEGMLFVSFAAKGTLDVHVQNMEEKPLETSLPPTENQNQSDTHEDEVLDVSLSMEQRISELESTLLLHLKQQKHRQVIHPLLQEVGMKLGLLNSTVAIDLQYLGVRLPFPPPVHNSFDVTTSFQDGSGSFVSRTGKTNDPTKIKGWREKFNTKAVEIAPEGLKNNSAFCSDMLDEYLENEAQQINERVAVFSKSSSPPVSYQLPSKSSSYVVTLDTLLKTRSVTVNKVQTNIQKHAPTGFSRNAAPFCSSGSQHNNFENRGKASNFSRLFQNDQPTMSKIQGNFNGHGFKKQPNMAQLRWNYGTMTSAKMQNLLQDMEEEAFFNGRVRTHITTERANFALSSLLTAKKSVKKTVFNRHHHYEVKCSEEFCRLGCICDSLQRKIRGPTHCRRVECMFDCNCFKHKVLLIHPPEVAKIQRGRRRALMAFPIADPERGDRPPPATTVTVLWKYMANEHDPEPVFVPKPAPPLKSLARMRAYVPRPNPQIREEDKDPVYLYFESMMTSARVREYNSNPPPQVHMFPSEKMMQRAEKSKHCFETGIPLNSQKRTELPKTAASTVHPDEPEPTKLLEILSECNWEPHRNLVLNALFWRINKDLLAEPFCLNMYKVQLLSTTFKKGESCSTLTYKVCVSRAEESKLTSDLQPGIKNMSKNRVLKTKKGNGVVSPDLDVRTSNPLIDQLQSKLPLGIFPLPTNALPTGYLKADKKKPGRPPHGLIKVNSKTYNQAKLLLGQMGALNPVNRLAAFATGRLCPRLQDQPKLVSDVSEPCLTKPLVEPSAVAQVTKPTPLTSSKPNPVNANAPNTVSEETRSMQSAYSKLVGHSTSLKEDPLITPNGAPPGRSPLVPAGSNIVHMPVTPPCSANKPSTELAKTTNLPPGQQVVLHSLPGVPGSNFVCQYNGQIIQLVPVAPGTLGQPKSSDGIAPQVMQTGKDTKSVLKPVNSTSTLKPLAKPFPVLAPKIISLSGSSGMNIASGTPAFNVQTSFPGKMGTFSFRICPPHTEGRSVGSDQSTKPPDPLVGAPSALILPGGFTLIKLPAVPAVPASLPVELSQKDKCIKKPISQSSPSTKQKCQASENNARTPVSENSNNNSAPTDVSGLSHGSSAQTFDSDGKEMLDPVDYNNKVTPVKHDWVPAGAQMILKNDDCDSENEKMDDWPPKGAERILWIDEESANDESDNFNELSHNSETHASDSTGTEAIKLKTTETTDMSLRACDPCLEKTTYQASNEINCKKFSLSAKDKELHKEPSNKAAQSLGQSFCSPKVSKQVLVDENCLQIKTESHQEPTHTDLIANQPEQYSEPPQINTFFDCSVNEGSQNIVPVIKPEPSHSSEPTLFNHPDSEQNLESSAQVLSNKALCSIPINQTGCLLSSSCYSSDLQCAIDSDEYVDVDGDVPFALLEGQTPARDTSPVTPLPNNDSKKTSKKSCLSPHFMQTQINEIQCNSNKLTKKEMNSSAWRNKWLYLKKANVDEQDDVCHMNTKENDESSSEGASTDESSSSDEEDSSNESRSTSDSETTEQSAGTSSQEDDFVNVETFEENEGNVDIWKMKAEGMHYRNAKKAGRLRKQSRDTLNHMKLILAKRQNHTEKERVRRGEMKQSFTLLKRALNIEDEITLCKHDILIQARLMIRALEKRSKTLEERKKALLDRRAASISIIAQLTGKTEESVMVNFKESYVYEKRCVTQNEVPFSASSPQKNLDNQGNKQPFLGLWQSNTHKESHKSCRPSSVSTTGKEKRIKLNFKENCQQEEHLDVQNQVQHSLSDPQINLRRLDSQGNPLPPRIGLWKTINYIRRRAKKSPMQPSDSTTVAVDKSSETCSSSPVLPGGPLPSVGTENIILKLVPYKEIGNLGALSIIASPKNLSTEQKLSGTNILPQVAQRSEDPPPSLQLVLGEAAKKTCTLSKIVLQSFGKTETVGELTDSEKSLPDFPEPSKFEEPSLVPQEQEVTENNDSPRICEATKNCSVYEDSNKGDPSSSLPVNKNNIESNTLPESEKDIQTTTDLVKVKKRRSASDVIIEGALSNPDVLGPRILRNRSPAVNKMSTQSTPGKKRRRII